MSDLKSALAAHVTTWRAVLGLDAWLIQVEVCPDTATFEAKTGLSDCLMTCESAWQYMALTLYADGSRITGENPHALEYAVLHELLHGVVSEMRNAMSDDDHEERVVTMLTRAFLRSQGAVANEWRENEWIEVRHE